MANCPNCGDHLPDLMRGALMVVCPSCDTTIYVLGDRLAQAGSSGEMHDAPLLVRLGDRVTVGKSEFTAVGHARFSYGPGWWDEFWLSDERGDGYWLSLDEGDVVLQSQVDALKGRAASASTIGDVVDHAGEVFTLTEFDAGACIALRGTFPERLAVGDRFAYANFSAETGALLSRETHAGESTWFLGKWLDPFELEVARA